MPELQKKPSSFQRFTNRLFDPGPNVSERSLQQNNQLADALFVAGSQSQPLRSSAQGFAQLAQALNSQILRKQGERGQEALKSQEAKQLGDVLANLSLEPGADELIRNLPKEIQSDVLGGLTERNLLPDPVETGSQQVRSGGNFETRTTTDGEIDTSDEGLLFTSPISQATSTDSPDQRDKKIRDAMTLHGISRAQATKVIDKQARVVRDDFGRSALIDDIEQSVTEIKASPATPNVEPRQVEQGQSLFSLAKKATGPVPTIQNALSVMFGPFGAPIAEEVVQARQTYNTATNDFIRALSINPKFPVAEINRIKEEINLTPKFFDSQELAQNRMISIDRSLRLRFDKERRAANNPNLGDTDRGNAAAAANDIDAFLRVLGAKQPGNQVPPEAAALGFTQENWDSLTISQQESF